jgi:hypothetical protein
MNGMRGRVGELRNRLPTRVVLAGTLVFFGWILPDTALG